MDARRRSKQKFNHARNLTEPGWQEAVSDERIFNSIANGRKKMPAFGKKITQAEIDSLVLLVRGMQLLSRKLLVCGLDYKWNHQASLIELSL